VTEAEIPEVTVWTELTHTEKTERIAPISNSLKYCEEEDEHTKKYPSFTSSDTEDVMLLMQFVEEIITAMFTHPNVIENALYANA